MPILRSPRNDEELAALHNLRDSVLFKGRGKTNYNRNHPHDLNPQNHFMGFWDSNQLIGTLRIDFLNDDTAVIRLVVVDPEKQKQGFGAMMMLAAESYILGNGRRFAVTNASMDAVNFYNKLDYTEHTWEDPAAGPDVPVCQMRKILQ